MRPTCSAFPSQGPGGPITGVMSLPDSSLHPLPDARVPPSGVKRLWLWSPATREIHRGRLFRRYLLLMLFLVTMVLGVSSAIGLYFSYQENKSALASLEKEKAISAASRIEQYVQQISQQLSYASLAQLDASDLEARRTEFWRLLRQAPEVTDIAQLDRRGREQIAVSRLGLDTMGSAIDRSVEPAFREAVAEAPWFGPVYFNRDTEPYMTVAIRAGGDQGGVTIAQLNLKFIWDVVSRIQVGQNGKAYVVDRDGLLVAHPDIGLVLRKTSVATLPHVRAAAQGGAQHDEAMVSQDLQGAAVLTSTALIQPLGWRVFVEQPISEVYAKLDASILRAMVLLLASLAVSALAASLLARRMVQPIRTLARGARRIGEGELDQQIVVNTGDELEGLAAQFNRMSAQLRESYGELERKVAARTAELSATLEFQTATAEILRVLSRSPTDLQPVLEAVTQRLLTLCRAQGCRIWLPEGDGLLPAAGHAGHHDDVDPPPLLDFDGTALVARAFRQAHTLHAEGICSTLAVPMLREGTAVGVIAVVRDAPGGFSAAQVRLVETFADQAVIAIQNARMFREIEEKSRQLEIANRHKSAFLANMTHELRTPLNAIIGFSEVLSEGMFGDINERQLEYLRDIHSSGRHLLSLINDVLDLSKIEAGRMELDLSCFNLGLLLDDALTLVRERAQRAGLSLSVEVGPGLEEWIADARKVKQVVINLLSNALKFTPPGGSIRLCARRADGDAQPVAELSVSDTGVGIATEDQSIVFEEFRQGGGDRVRKAQGTGLGLPLSRRFVELHGGQLSLTSRSGEGSTFRFTLPLQGLEIPA
jgi:signal transduction histidine kinase